MNLPVPPFPSDESQRSIDLLSERLARAVPEKDREEARQLLSEKFFPLSLAGRDPPEFLERNLHEYGYLAYDDIAEAFAEVPPGKRLQALKEQVALAKVREQVDHSHVLAVARYFLDHPEALNRPEAKVWREPLVERWCAKGVVAIAAEAMRRMGQLWGLEDELREVYPGQLMEHASFYWALHQLLMAGTGEVEYLHEGSQLTNFLRDMGLHVPEDDEAE